MQQVWQQLAWREGQVQWRSPEQIPPGAQLVVTPHDPEARPGCHGSQQWQGYSLHLTETCNDDLPHLITDVAVVPASTEDHTVSAHIQSRLAQRDLLPAEHLVDAGYTSGHGLVDSREQYGIDLIGPVADESSWWVAPPAEDD